METSTAQTVELFQGKDAACQFFSEVIGAVETLSEIADSHGSETMADLMYLQMSILKGEKFSYFPEASQIFQFVNSLPSGEEWLKFFKREF
jgi:hypothetical protein